MKLKKILATGIMAALSLCYCLQVSATANVAIDAPPLAEQISSAVMLDYSRPTFDILSVSLDEAKDIGYFYDFNKNNKVKLRQYCGTVGMFKNPRYDSFSITTADLIPFGIIVYNTDWEKFRSIILSVDVNNCLDCALYEKTKDPYKLKDHLVSLRSFSHMIRTLNTRNNYALKQSAYNRLMQNDKEFAEVRKKAKENGFKLCPVVPDDYPGLSLDSYVNRVQTHMNAVDEKMKKALQ